MSSTPNSAATIRGKNVSWLDAIPEGPFRFRLGTRPGDAADYFAPTDAHREILAERRHWLESDPERYAGLLPEGIPVLDAACKLWEMWPAVDNAAVAVLPIDSAPFEKCLALGMSWEPDFALMRRDVSGRMALVGGCVCFPTKWRLTDKMGQPMRVIHDVVPGLTASIGESVDSFLSRMKPRGCWTRSNWSITRTSKRNQHPDLRLPEFTGDSGVDEVWLRIEDQALVSLPEVAGLLFGIRIGHISFRDVLQNAVACDRLRTTIETMTPEMLRYKNIAVIRDRIVKWLWRDSAPG
jgi:hypothetical protein